MRLSIGTIARQTPEAVTCTGVRILMSTPCATTARITSLELRALHVKQQPAALQSSGPWMLPARIMEWTDILNRAQSRASVMCVRDTGHVSWRSQTSNNTPWCSHPQCWHTCNLAGHLQFQLAGLEMDESFANHVTRALRAQVYCCTSLKISGHSQTDHNSDKSIATAGIPS